MRKSCQLFAVVILLLQLNHSPILAVNINISSQITKKDGLVDFTFVLDTIPVEDPYGERMEPLNRRRGSTSAKSGYSYRPNSYSNNDNYWERGIDDYYEEETKTLIIEEPLIEVYNENAKVKMIEEDYNGFKVEITNSPDPLLETDAIFTQHGNIAQQKRADETYSYYLGHFENEVDAYEFYNKILKERYPLARVAKFEAGRRVW